jgi:HAE1 family hydrophobic/amphiphilic exporter-1
VQYRADHLHARRLPLVDPLAGLFVRGVVGFTRATISHWAYSLYTVLLVALAVLAVTWLLLPKLEYLPEGNRNLVFGIILPPPGYNLDTLIPVLRNPVFREPGTFGFISQPSIFGRGIGGGRSINLDISGPDLNQVLGVALQAAGLVSQAMPREAGNQLRPLPGLELGAPEVRVVPDRLRLADSGVSARELGLTVDTFNDGLRVDEITVDGRRIDLMLQGAERNVNATQDIVAPWEVASSAFLPLVERTRDGDFAELMAQDTKTPRRVAEAFGGFCRGGFIDEERA